MPVTHSTIATLPDEPGAEINKAEWNANHTVSVSMSEINATGTPSAATFLRGDGSWQSPSGSGDVVGPSSATDNAVTRYDTTTGKLIQNSVVLIDDAGAITGVTTLAASGAVTASNISGSNTGDQTSIVGITGTKAEFDTACTDGNFLYVGDVTQYTDELAQDAVGGMVDSSLVYVDATPLLQRAALTGDVTASAGSNSTTIANDAVSYAKMQNVSAASKLLGRGDSGSGDVQEITLGTNLSMSGTTLNATGGGASPLTTKGDIYGFSTVDARVPVGTDGQVLTADSAQALGVKWATVSGTGDVIGPASATDNAIARFDTTTGKLIQNSGATIDDSGNLTATNISGTNTGDQSLFRTISVSGQSDVVADSTTDTLTLVAGSNITITTNATTDTITIAASGGGGGSSAFTLVEKDLGTNPRRSGKFTITGLSGLTTNKPVNIFQAVGPYTSKGTLADEAEMDGLIVKAIVTAADTITAYWNSATAVRGNFKFNYLVGA